MGDVPMPRDLSEEAVAEWLYNAAVLKRMQSPGFPLDRYADWDEAKPVVRDLWRAVATIVLAWGREKVREAVRETKDSTDPRCDCDNSGTGGQIHIGFDDTEAIVARVMGKEAPK